MAEEVTKCKYGVEECPWILICDDEIRGKCVYGDGCKEDEESVGNILGEE